MKSPTLPNCNIYGNFKVHKAPGNFHISFHSYFQLYDFLTNKLKLDINLEYEIKSLRIEYPDQVDFREKHISTWYTHLHD